MLIVSFFDFQSFKLNILFKPSTPNRFSNFTFRILIYILINFSIIYYVNFII